METPDGVVGLSRSAVISVNNITERSLARIRLGGHYIFFFSYFCLLFLLILYFDFAFINAEITLIVRENHG